MVNFHSRNVEQRDIKRENIELLDKTKRPEIAPCSTRKRKTIVLLQID